LSNHAAVCDLFAKCEHEHVVPADTAMYCLPSSAYAIGPDAICSPNMDRHSKAPVRASSAKK
jgi:hypothetical protein